MKMLTTSQAGSVTAKIFVAACLGAIAFFCNQIYLRVQDDRKHEKELKALEELQKIKRDTVAEMTNGFRPGTSAKAIEKVRDLIDKKNTQAGTDVVAMKALSEFLAELQQQSAPYAELVKQMGRDNPANMLTVKEKADLTKRRVFAREFVKQNTVLISFLDSAESRFRDKLQKFGASGEITERALGGFQEGFGKSLPMKLRIRIADVSMGKAIISMCDLLEAEWGEWEVRDDHLVFANESAGARYNDFRKVLTNAAQEQAAAQREVAELLRKE